jgi:hypothetical protein
MRIALSTADSNMERWSKVNSERSTTRRRIMARSDESASAAARRYGVSVKLMQWRLMAPGSRPTLRIGLNRVAGR